MGCITHSSSCNFCEDYRIYLIMLPLYELAKIFVGDKVVGVVKQNVNYYADAAEWYVEELINRETK